jgi:vacuolar-type H+-ATPase subunit E/Vma4
MNQEHLQKLAEASNVEALQRAIEAMCQPFGSPKDIRLLPNRRDEEYVCFVELGSPKLNGSIIKNFDGSYFANGVVFRIPFKHAND